MFSNFFFENHAGYEIVCKTTVEPDIPVVTEWGVRIARCITKATNTYLEYVILIAFPLRRWLHERA